MLSYSCVWSISRMPARRPVSAMGRQFPHMAMVPPVVRDACSSTAGSSWSQTWHRYPAIVLAHLPHVVATQPVVISLRVCDVVPVVRFWPAAVHFTLRDSLDPHEVAGQQLVLNVVAYSHVSCRLVLPRGIHQFSLPRLVRLIVAVRNRRDGPMSRALISVAVRCSPSRVSQVCSYHCPPATTRSPFCRVSTQFSPA